MKSAMAILISVIFFAPAMAQEIVDCPQDYGEDFLPCERRYVTDSRNIDWNTAGSALGTSYIERSRIRTHYIFNPNDYQTVENPLFSEALALWRGDILIDDGRGEATWAGSRQTRSRNHAIYLMTIIPDDERFKSDYQELALAMGRRDLIRSRGPIRRLPFWE